MEPEARQAAQSSQCLMAAECISVLAIEARINTSILMVGTFLISSGEQLSTMLTYRPRVAAAMLLSTWSQCPDTMLSSTRPQVEQEISTVMQTRLVESGAQRWTSWRLTPMLGIQHLTTATPLKANTTLVATKEVIPMRSIAETRQLMVQVTNTKSTLCCHSM